MSTECRSERRPNPQPSNNDQRYKVCNGATANLQFLNESKTATQRLAEIEEGTCRSEMYHASASNANFGESTPEQSEAYWMKPLNVRL
jgi:hypothetical protein